MGICLPLMADVLEFGLLFAPKELGPFLAVL
jgi:hypothetical protein